MGMEEAEKWEECWDKRWGGGVWGCKRLRVRVRVIGRYKKKREEEIEQHIAKIMETIFTLFYLSSCISFRFIYFPYYFHH
jgi:hypothetical protein